MSVIRCVLVVLALGGLAAAEPAPLVAHWPMEDGARMSDAGSHGLHGGLGPGIAVVDDGRQGRALRFDGSGDNRVRVRGELLDRIGSPLTVALWIRPEQRPEHSCGIVTKRNELWQGTPFTLGIRPDLAIFLDATNGKNGAGNLNPGTRAPLGRWTHVAFTHEAGGDIALWVDGREVARRAMPGTLAPSVEPLVFGREKEGGWAHGERSRFQGAIDEVLVFASALDGDRIQALARGEAIPTRAATEKDFAPARHYVKLRLSVFDQAIGGRGTAQTRYRTARRIAGPDAVDWPAMLHQGERLFVEHAEHEGYFPLFDRPRNMAVYRQDHDSVLQPGDHWFRTTTWLWGRRFAYTALRHARASDTELEIWTFPLRIAGRGPGALREVRLEWDGHELYRRAERLDSLTLLLPASGDTPYRLQVNGGEPVELRVGLQPVDLAAPADRPLVVERDLPGGITLRNAPAPFAADEAWTDDQRAVAQLAAVARAETGAAGSGVPVVGHWRLGGSGDRIADDAGLALHGRIHGAAARDAEGVALGADSARIEIPHAAAFRVLGEAFTLEARLRLERLPAHHAPIALQRSGWYEATPFGLYVTREGQLGVDLHRDGRWEHVYSGGGVVQPGRELRVALSYDPAGEVLLAVDGRVVARRAAIGGLGVTAKPLRLGHEEGSEHVRRAPLPARVSELWLYARALDQDQLRTSAADGLALRPAVELMDRSPLPEAAPTERTVTRMADLLGIEVDRSPLQVYACSLTHGMSGGFFMSSAHGPEAYNHGIRWSQLGDAAAYARFLRATGYDLVFEQTSGARLDRATHDHSLETLAAALRAEGLRLGVNAEFLADSNLPLYVATLPQWREAALRDLQLLGERLRRQDNVVGVTMGADNACYEYFWGWSPPIPEKHWGWAVANLMGPGFDDRTPIPPTLEPGRRHERRARDMADFLGYLRRYDRTWTDSYAALGAALAEQRADWFLTTGSFGSSPGVGSTGGWAWASAPGDAMFAGLGAIQTYDWNETRQTKPLHQVALIDRARSTHPEKPTYALLDDFEVHLHGAGREREFALALTRGIDAIGTSFLPQPSGAHARPEVVATQRALADWVHRFGGAYAMSEPQPTVAILYVHEQAQTRSRPDDSARGDGLDAYGRREPLVAGPHEGKTTNALFLCHAAGHPAKLVTPAELRRGLADSVQVLLLTGLPTIDDSWHWSQGLEDALQAFVDRGGRILRDHESTCPVASEASDLRIRSYLMPRAGHGLQHFGDDVLQVLFERDPATIDALRERLAGGRRPIAGSDEPTVWAVPHRAGDTDYVTVLNYGYVPGENPTQVLRPQQVALEWNTERPIYDLRSGERFDPASPIDLRTHGFQCFALPARAPEAPQLRFATDAEGFVVATVDLGPGLDGIPVRLDLEREGERVSLHSASGLTARLPVDGRLPGELRVVATELLGGERSEHRHRVAPATGEVEDDRLARFLERDAPLVIALTAEQEVGGLRPAAERLQRRLASAGRAVELRRLEPGAVVVGPQPYRSAFARPRWRSVDADLVLLGWPGDNPLLYDQAAGLLLAPEALEPDADAPRLEVTLSPFRAGRWCLNVLGRDEAALRTGLRQVEDALP